MAKSTEQLLTFISEAKKFSDVVIEQIKLLNEMAGQIQTTYQVPSDYLKQMKELAKAQAELAKANKENITSTANLEKVKQQELVTKQKKIDLERKQLSLSEQQRKATLAQEQAEKRRVAQAERLAKQTLNQNSAYLKLNATWRAAQRTLADLLATEGASTKEIAKARAEFERLDKQVKTIDNSVKNYSKNVGNYKSALGGINVMGGLTTVAGAFGIGAGLSGAISVLKDSFAIIREFDSQMINVQKTTGATNTEILDLKDGVLALSDELKIISSQQLGQYMAVAGQLGVKGKANLLAFTDAMAQLEVASTIAGEEGAAEIARLLTLTDGGVQNVKAFGNEIVILGNNFAATESEILANATRIAQNTGVYKVGRQEVLAYATATKAVGVEAELVGSTMGRTLGIFEKAIRTNKGLDNITKALNTTQEELAERFKTDASGVLLDYIKALNQIDKEGGSVNAQLESIGVTAIRDRAVISSLATNGFEPLVSAMEKVTDAGNAMGDEFENASKKINNELAKISVSWSNLILSIDSGDGLISKGVSFILNQVDARINEFRRFNSNWQELNAKSMQSGVQEGIKQADSVFKMLDSQEKVTAEMIRTVAAIADAEQKIIDLQAKADNESGLYGFGFGKNALNKDVEKANKSLGFLKGYLEQIKALNEGNKPVTTSTVVTEEEELTPEEIKRRADAFRRAEQERLALEHQVAQAELALQIENDYKLALAETKNAEERLEIQLAYIYSKRALIEQQYNEEVRLAEGNTDKLRLADIKRLNDTQKNQSELEKLVIDFEDKKAEEIQKGIDERRKLDEQEKKEAEERQKQHVDRMISYLSKYTDLGQFGFSSLNTVFDKNFQELMKNGTAMERMQGIATVTGDVLKDVFSNIADIQRANFEAQMNRLDEEKTFAITMAGENSAAKEEIEKQYEEKRKELARRQAEADKKQAIFSTTISIAQGVAAALPNLVLAGVVASLGAIQLGAIIATPIPEYWTGTDNAKEGLAWTQERGAEVITDKRGNVKTYGHNKGATLTYMEQGDKVFKSQDAYLDSLNTSELDSILISNNIQRTIEYKGVTASEMRSIMNDSVSNIVVESTIFDELGINKRRAKMSKKQTKRNRYANS